MRTEAATSRRLQNDPIAAFANAMRAAGIDPPSPIIADGKLHRFATNGRRDNDAGWLVLHLDMIPAGAFGDWRTGTSETWCARSADSLTPAEREAWRARIEKARQEAAAEREREHREGAKLAKLLWDTAALARGDHPYLTSKRVKPPPTLWELSAAAIKSLVGYAPKAKGEELTGRVLIAPIVVSGGISSIEMIDEGGRKAFLAGGAVSCGYWATDKLIDDDGATIMIAEGIATALSASEATGNVAVAALSAGNMPAVARVMRERFPKARLIMLADLDQSGVGLAKASEAARLVGGPVIAPNLDDMVEGDFNDMAVLRGLDAVRVAIEGAKVLSSELPPQRRLTAVSLHDFLARDIPPREMLLNPILPTQGLALLYSWRGVGKTHAALGIAYATASGGRFLRWEAPKPRRVLYIDGEMPGAAMQERLAAIVAAEDREPPAADYLRIITPDLQQEFIPNLASAEGRVAVEEWLRDGVDLLIIDNLSTLCRTGGESEADAWEDTQGWLLTLRRRGISVLLVHHSGKDGRQRGTSRREDILDAVIKLQHPSDYQTVDGARFEVVYEKTRGAHGDAVKPFEAKLEVRGGAAFWTTRDVADANLERVRAMLEDGMSIRDIGEELGISKSAVHRLKKKIEAQDSNDE